MQEDIYLLFIYSKNAWQIKTTSCSKLLFNEEILEVFLEVFDKHVEKRYTITENGPLTGMP